MAEQCARCPRCGSARVRYREHRSDCFCDDCDHRWAPDGDDAAATDLQRPLLFLSYARRDASDLADRLKGDLEAGGYRVWLDRPEIKPGGAWEHQIVDGLRAAQLLVAVLTPSAVRKSNDPTNPDQIDSVCLEEISFARFGKPPTAIVPVMAQLCEPPLSIFRLDYVDMSAWRDSEDLYQAGLKRLLAGIKEALGGKVAYRAQINALQPWDFAAFLFEKRRDFCGREWLFREIDLWLKTNREPALLITGDPGTGKSALVAELVHRNPGGQVLAYHCCQADVLATIEPARFVRSIAAMIASKLPGYAARVSDLADEDGPLGEEKCAIDPFTAFEAGVLTPLQQLPAPSDGVRYVLIDALDESLPPQGGSAASGTFVALLSTFIERLPGWLRIVATTRKEPAVLQRLAGLRAREIAAQDSRNIDDMEEYFRQQFQTPNLSQQLTEAGLSLDVAVTTLRDHAGGNFLYATQVCTGLERGLYHLADLGALPPGLYPYYQRFFERQFPDTAAFEAVRPVLEALVAAETPLMRETLARVSGIHDEPALSAALRPLGAFLVHDESGYRIFHKSLTDWLTAPSRVGEDFYIESDRGKNRLADPILTSAADRAATISRGTRAVLLRRLASTGEWDRLYVLLQDFSFVEPIDSGEWAVLYPQLVLVADQTERDRLQPLPLTLVNVGWQRVSHGDHEMGVYMFYRAFSAILGLVNRDPTTAPWLLQFLIDLATMRGMYLDNPRSRMLLYLSNRVIQDDVKWSAYAGHVQTQSAEALRLLDRSGIAAPGAIREWVDQMQAF
jgi:hypothetical protein